MKEEMGVANKMTSSVLDREHAARAFAHKKRANQLVFMVCGEKRQLSCTRKKPVSLNAPRTMLHGTANHCSFTFVIALTSSV